MLLVGSQSYCRMPYCISGMKNRIFLKFALCKLIANIKYAKLCTHCKKWQLANLHKLCVNVIFVTGLHNANCGQIQFFTRDNCPCFNVFCYIMSCKMLHISTFQIWQNTPTHYWSICII